MGVTLGDGVGHKVLAGYIMVEYLVNDLEAQKLG